MAKAERGVCFLFGAGASRPAGVPVMNELGREFFDGFALPELRSFLDDFDREMASHDPSWRPDDRNIEAALKVLQSKQDAVRTAPVPAVTITDQVIARSSAIVAHELKKFVLAKVTRIASIGYLRPLCEFVPNDAPLDIFTLNYDAVVEQFCADTGIRCTDGFDNGGDWAPAHYFEATDGIRLWKLHGSADWVATSSGWPRKLASPGSWRRYMRSGHTASATAEAALVWPAATKRLDNALLLLDGAFRRVLRSSSVLVVVGYRFADAAIADAVIDGLAHNGALHVIILCGSRANSEAARQQLLSHGPSYITRVEIFNPGYIDVALATGGLRARACDLLSKGRRATALARHDNDVLCLGDFVAAEKWGDTIVVATGNGPTRLARLDLAKPQLLIITEWRGWARGLSLISPTHAIVADCRRAGFKSGWGVLWTIDLRTGERTKVLRSSLIDFARAIYRTANYRAGFGAAANFLDYGMLSWPTSVEALPNTSEVLVTEARRVLLVDVARRIARPLTGPQFFNLLSVRYLTGTSCLLLEHVLRKEGVLWMFDFSSQALTPLLAGIRNATGLVVTPDKSTALVSQGDDAPEGTIVSVGLATKRSITVAKDLHRPGAMLFLNDGALAVATAGALVRVPI